MDEELKKIIRRFSESDVTPDFWLSHPNDVRIGFNSKSSSTHENFSYYLDKATFDKYVFDLGQPVKINGLRLSIDGLNEIESNLAIGQALLKQMLFLEGLEVAV